MDERAVAGLPAGVCLPGDTTLCLDEGRFKVTVEWETTQGTSGAGKAKPLTADTGYFWFFDPDNVEQVVKVLDACPVDGHLWVFAGGLDAVVYGAVNSNGLIDETGVAGEPEVADVASGHSIERIDIEGRWRDQRNPTPNETPLN